ncbi:MAG: YcaO-like family protein, partial [Myxococcales bacterium]|nr:YcaO-like family protein [Myxococcales bacterium]
AEPELDRFVESVARARRAADGLTGPTAAPSPAAVAELDASFGLERSLKREGEPRFCLTIEEAHAHAERLAELVGVTRVAMITRLSELEGFHVSQAARPSGAWSSSYGSGKSSTPQGAMVGAIMEETEKWAQERFVGQPRWSSYAALRDQVPALDPRALDLPYDSPYHEDLEIAWHECVDLLSAERIHVPLAAIACSFNAGHNNILFCARGSRVTFSTNGLASGFTLAEALVHGTCEYIERHAARLAELRVENPGTSRRETWPRRIELGSLPPSVARLVEGLQANGGQLELWDISSEVRVPTVYARLVQDQELARGWACHPNPALAAQMAVLEAGQTVVAAIAAGREDLIIKARSLGRHERANPLRGSALAYWKDPDAPTVALSELRGLVSNDAYAELDWIRQRLREAGLRRLVAVDLTQEAMRPARAVRVLIPGLETNNPYYTGPRAAAALLDDMLPWASPPREERR